MTNEERHPDQDPDSEVPFDATQIPGIDLAEVLGRGGMGIVYRGRQAYLERDVAVKFLDVRTATGAFESRFRREARLLAGITHPNIVACYQAGTTDEGFCYLVMEYIEGPDLDRWITDNGPLQPQVAISVCRDIAIALDHAHRLGIIHRDVKSANIFLGHDEELARVGDPFPFTVKLGDLGLARPTATEIEGHENLTRSTQGVLGSPATMAPEQFEKGSRVDLRADIYGLGCVLYHALTGQPAFSGALPELIHHKFEPHGPDPRELRGDIPEDLGRLVQRQLAKDPDERPQDYAEVLELLDCQATTGTPESRSKGISPLALGVLILLFVALGVNYWPDTEQAVGKLTPEVISEVRSGWIVDLHVEDEGLADWEWSWNLQSPENLALEITGANTAAANFVAPSVSEITPLIFRARAIRDDVMRQAEVRVKVHPPLALEISGPEQAREDEVLTYEALTGQGPRLGERTFRWTRTVRDRESAEASGTRFQFTAPQARASYEMVLELMALENGRQAGRVKQRVAVEASDEAASARRVTPVLVTAPLERISLSAELVDADSPVRWSLPVPGGPVSLTGTNGSLLDASGITERTEIWIDVKTGDDVQTRQLVMIEPSLGSFPAEPVQLVPEEGVGTVPGWTPCLLVLPGGDPSVKSAVVTAPRFREQDDWTIATFQSGTGTVGLLEHAVPSRQAFRLLGEIGLHLEDETPLKGIGVLVREASLPGEPTRAVALRLRDGASTTEIVEELLEMILTPVPDEERARLAPASAGSLLRGSEPTVIAEQPPAARSGYWPDALELSEYLVLARARFEVIREGSRLRFQWGERTVDWEMPDDFQPGAIAIWTQMRRSHLRGLWLEAR